MALTALALNCTLKAANGEPSSTDKLLGELLAALKGQGVESEAPIRVVEHDVRPGVSSDEGDGDAWPAIRAKIVAADILVVGTPVWMGQMSSVAKRVTERLDAFLSETDEQDRTPAYGKVAVAAIVGNEDGAHHISATLFQALNDVGFTIPAAGVTYWVGEAMGAVDYKDLKQTPDKVAAATAMLAKNAAHLAALLKATPYPGGG